MSPACTLLHGDCLQVLPSLPAGSVDLVFADLPYGVTANRWDTMIPFEPLWLELLRVAKLNAAFVFTATFEFAVALRNSQKRLNVCDIIWRKKQISGFLNANRQPLRAHEFILVFSRAQPTYNSQKTYGHPHIKRTRKTVTGNYGTHAAVVVGDGDDSRHPTSVITIDRDDMRGKNGHPTQKPVALLEWLVRTYSNPGDTVLDPTMGSGTTGVACLNTGRRFVGIEKDAGYFACAQNRIKGAPCAKM